MKKTIILLLALTLLASLAILSGCSGEPQPVPAESDVTEPGSESAPESRAPAEISDEAMTRFLEKLEAGNYVIDYPEYVKVNVCSDDLVYYLYTYVIRHDNVDYNGVAVLTVNGNETFSGILAEDSLQSIAFVNEGKAVDIISEGDPQLQYKLCLPNSWSEASQGNIWDLFYNDTENPLRFVSTAAVVKNTVRDLAGISNIVFERMEEVTLELDKEDPTEAHLKASFSEGYPPAPEVDIAITFGTAVSDARVDAWMNDPDREYPEPRTDWGVDELNLNAVFLPEYGVTAVPFPDFATYAFTVDISGILAYDEIYFRDSRATEQGMRDYIDKLLSLGFSAVTDEDGITWYRLLLREEYGCYSSICLEYDNGISMLATKYYDFPSYTGLEDTNRVLAGHGYPELKSDPAVSGFLSYDSANEMEESWLYFFDYDLSLYVTLRYSDRAAIDAYLESYVQSLGDGYELAYNEGDEEYGEVLPELAAEEDAARFSRLKSTVSEGNYYKCQTESGLKTFRYHFEDDGETVTLLFKSENYLPAETVRGALAEAGFPEIALDHCNSGRDQRKFQKTMYGRDLPLELSLSFKFETAAEAEAFLEQYISALQDASFDVTPPASVEIGKSRAYSKEEGSVILIFAFDYTEGSTEIPIEFRVAAPAED